MHFGLWKYLAESIVTCNASEAVIDKAVYLFHGDEQVLAKNGQQKIGFLRFQCCPSLREASMHEGNHNYCWK